MSPVHDIAVRLLSPEEAPFLTKLIRRCYSESYIDSTFYDHERVRERLSTGALCSIGAFEAGGQLIGHMGVTRRRPAAITADAGMTLVDPDYRGLGIARKVAGGLARQAIAMGLIGVHDYPVTVHGATQRIGRGFSVDTGLMLANLPADVVFQGMSASSEGTRTSSLIRWIPFAVSPERSVFLPARYREQIESLYASCYLTRREGSADGSRASRSMLSAFHDGRREIVRIDVKTVGMDIAARVAGELRAPGHEDAAVVQVDLRLGDRLLPSAVEELRDLGFFFAGLLPEYSDGDVLRLQRLSESVDITIAEVIASDSTRAIETFVLEDRP